MVTRNPLVIHYVYNMQRAKEFYQSVFEVPVLFASPGWTTLDFGPVELALHILPGERPGTGGPTGVEAADLSTTEAPIPHAGINFEVDDIEALQARIERWGGRLVELREPEANVPVRVASFKDCEGNGFELRQLPIPS